MARLGSRTPATDGAVPGRPTPAPWRLEDTLYGALVTFLVRRIGAIAAKVTQVTARHRHDCGPAPPVPHDRVRNEADASVIVVPRPLFADVGLGYL